MAEYNYYEDRLFENLNLLDSTAENIEFESCTFKNCRFENTLVKKVKFSLCTFDSCSIINPSDDNSVLVSCNFKGCALYGVNWLSLCSSGRFAKPVEAFKNCNLKYNTFANMNFRRFDFKGNSITVTLFAECDLSDASFYGCDLAKTEFFKCDLKKCDFRDAYGYRIDVLTNSLKGARFCYPEVSNLFESLEIVIE